MKRERVLLTSIVIDKPKQVKLFQVKLPRETETVRGVELGLRWLDGDLPVEEDPEPWSLPFLMKPNLAIGEVKLQSCGKANIFYTAELQLNSNLDYVDYTSLHWKPTVHTHQGSRFEEEVKVEGTSTMLQGFFKDKFYEQAVGAFKYAVSVYVWIEQKTK